MWRTGALIAPFAGACCLAWIAVPVGSAITWWEYALSVVMAATAGGAAFFALLTGRHTWLAVVPTAVLLLTAVALLRDSGGGILTGAGALAILPVFQVALYSRSRRDLGIILAALVLFYLIPTWVVGPPAYPATQYRTTVLAVAADAIIGFTTQRLVARVLREVQQARARGRMLEQVTHVVDGLFDSPHPRQDVCEAVLSISSATSAVLYEKRDDSGRLTRTTAAGLSSEVNDVIASRQSPVHEAMVSGLPRLINEEVEAHVGSTDLWIARGRPSSLLYQPLRRGEALLGVLVIGWPDRVPERSPLATVAALLAHEAAAVISRADTLDHLSDQALTDGLTGLPNRRAWDRHLRAVADGSRVTIAILDLDHFKEFNDTHGHPAGDRLLKETAAAWRDQLRSGDVLARIGGEEFGLLLSDCDMRTAVDVVERLRTHVTHGRTCSAGIAVQGRHEASQLTVERADVALYRAKARGRDQTQVADLTDLNASGVSARDPEQPSAGTP